MESLIMEHNVILGIHSNVIGGDYSGGHAWITVTHSGFTSYYGLWPDAHPAVPDNGPGWDVRKSMERNSKAKASRYYKLTPDQVRVLNGLLQTNVTWGYTHNCSSWAHGIIKKVVRENIDANDYFWFSETPRELGRSILGLEMQDPTNLHNPKDTAGAKQQSSK